MRPKNFGQRDGKGALGAKRAKEIEGLGGERALRLKFIFDIYTFIN